MKVIRWFFKTVIDILAGCFYLFSACTLFVTCAVILGIGIGMMDISGKAQDLILWGYVAFVGTYFVAKIVLWLVKLYRKTFCLWDKTIKKHNSSEKPILPPR